jgi:hypothetical protein
VDCSVAPGVSWRRYKGAPDGCGGPDYFAFPCTPYFLDLSNIERAGTSALLEVPVTIRPTQHPMMRELYHAIEGGMGGKLFRRVRGYPYAWLRPNGRNLRDMLETVDWALERGLPVLEFMLHSAEFMPGGSPTFKEAEQVEVLYEHLGTLFARVAAVGGVGMTLAEYRATC